MEKNDQWDKMEFENSAFGVEKHLETREKTGSNN